MKILTILHSLFHRLERVRVFLGWALEEWHKRLGEFYLAVITIINGYATTVVLPNGNSLAPFLSSSVKMLTHETAWWAWLMMVFGFIHLGIVIGSFGKGWLALRSGLCFLQCALYCAVSAAIVTGPPPLEAGQRYFLNAWVAFWVCVALAAQCLRQQDDTHWLRRKR